METSGENVGISMYSGDTLANPPHRPGPSKATTQRLRCRPSTGEKSRVLRIIDKSCVFKREIMKATVGLTLLQCWANA